jgi:hypothetical protein
VAEDGSIELSYFQFQLESSGTCVPLRLVRSGSAVGVRLCHYLVHTLDRCKCGLVPVSSEVDVVNPEEDLRSQG